MDPTLTTRTWTMSLTIGTSNSCARSTKKLQLGTVRSQEMWPARSSSRNLSQRRPSSDLSTPWTKYIRSQKTSRMQSSWGTFSMLQIESSVRKSTSSSWRYTSSLTGRKESDLQENSGKTPTWTTPMWLQLSVSEMIKTKKWLCAEMSLLWSKNYKESARWRKRLSSML